VTGLREERFGSSMRDFLIMSIVIIALNYSVSEITDRNGQATYSIETASPLLREIHRYIVNKQMRALRAAAIAYIAATQSRRDCCSLVVLLISPQFDAIWRSKTDCRLRRVLEHVATGK